MTPDTLVQTALLRLVQTTAVVLELVTNLVQSQNVFATKAMKDMIAQPNSAQITVLVTDPVSKEFAIVLNHTWVKTVPQSLAETVQDMEHVTQSPRLVPAMMAILAQSAKPRLVLALTLVVSA